MSDHESESGFYRNRNGRAERDESYDAPRPIHLPRPMKDPSNPWALAFRVAERFGFPALVAIGLGCFVYFQQTKFLDAITANTAAINRVSVALDKHLTADERKP